MACRTSDALLVIRAVDVDVAFVGVRVARLQSLQPEDAGEDEIPPEGWDPAKYQAIGESDRMTLKFVKPAE